jgi:hypothetical protein
MAIPSFHADENKYMKKLLKQFLPPSEAEIEGVSLSSCPQHSLKALLLL